ncbi:hypothetical protein PQ472_06885 [Lacticaseibacillus pabuli]|uniref:Uncharacterized protein n=1 Tax=Lacticaseibacillus pabuli TaxID=3025672 RepID=A0ABY7WUQ2_9LACO|nr:hypothetical protein [Lacticaseibacillus sp. KACC 23028]WDF81655.1 hypothetical protein PQ472_06885 [Lacticaseibacillus sp. KACC 23028]
MSRNQKISLELLIVCLDVFVVVPVTKWVITDSTTNFLANGGLLLLIFAVDIYQTRQSQAQVAKMWQLANQLGYGPAKLNELAPKYSEQDWANTRPNVHRFYPDATLVNRLIDQFNTQLRQHVVKA